MCWDRMSGCSGVRGWNEGVLGCGDGVRGWNEGVEGWNECVCVCVCVCVYPYLWSQADCEHGFQLVWPTTLLLSSLRTAITSSERGE